MIDPSNYKMVVNISFITMLLTYSTISVLGYMTFGSEVQGLLVESLDQRSIGYYLIQCITAFIMAMKIPLAAAPISEGLQDICRQCLYPVLNMYLNPYFYHQPLDGTSFETDYYSNVARKKLKRGRQSLIEDDDDEFGMKSCNLEETKEPPDQFTNPVISKSASNDLANEIFNENENLNENDLFAEISPDESPVQSTVDPHHLQNKALHKLIGFVLRTTVQIVALLISMTFISVESLIIFVGGVFGVIGSMLLPVICYWQIERHEKTVVQKLMLTAYVVIGVGIVMAVSFF